MASALQSQHTELEWTVKIRKFHDSGTNTAGDVFEFRVVEADGTPLAGYGTPAAVTLMHPPGLIGGTHVESPHRLGPFADGNGNLYYIAEPTEEHNVMIMLKSADGGDTWHEVDAANRPETVDLESVDVRQVGHTLHIAHHPGGAVVHHSFAMSSSPTSPDSWVIRDEEIDSGLTEIDQAVALEVLSDGRMTVFYAAATSGQDRIRYKTRSSAGVWDSSAQVLDDGSGTWSAITTVRAETGDNIDRIFAFSFDSDSGDVSLRTLDPDGSLSAPIVVQSVDPSQAELQPVLPPVHWHDGGEDRVLVAYLKADEHIYSRLVTGTSVGPESLVTDRAADTDRGKSGQAVADLVVNGDKAHLLYADATEFDLWTDATASGSDSWRTDVEVVDDVRVNWVRGNVFDHATANGGERVYGFAYEDHDVAIAGHGTGYIRYDEFSVDGIVAAPIAYAGPDVTVVDTDGDGVEAVTLAGSAIAGDAAITGYTWSDGGPIATGPTPTVDLAVGTHRLTLTVTDANDITDTDTVTVTVRTASTTPVRYVSFESGTTVPGVGSVSDEDIVAYDEDTATWSMYVDNSDVGVTADLNGFHVRPDGSVLMTLSSQVAVPGLVGGPDGEVVDDSDVILFTPTNTGTNTGGSFSFYFDGSDVDLTSSGEDVDGLFEFADGSLGISTKGTARISGLDRGRDEDIHRFAGAFGPVTSGTWSLYFDGGDVGLTASADDIDALSGDGPDLVFSTTGTNSVSGSHDEDLSRFVGTYGPVTTGVISPALDLSSLGIATDADVDGFHRAG